MVGGMVAFPQKREREGREYVDRSLLVTFDRVRTCFIVKLGHGSRSCILKQKDLITYSRKPIRCHLYTPTNWNSWRRGKLERRGSVGRVL